MEREQMALYLTAYGNAEQKDKGIVRLVFNRVNGSIRKESTYPLNGKANMVIDLPDQLIVSVKGPEKTTLDFYGKNGIKMREVATDLFYSFASPAEGGFLLASYESGADSFYDLTADQIRKTVVHKREGYEKAGKSHFIHQMEDGRCISVENSLQQIYVYKDEGLEIEDVINFPQYAEKNIRLLAFSQHHQKAYLNTELTNEIIVLDTKEFAIIKEIKMTDEKEVFSGGHSIREDEKLLCTALRGKNVIVVSEICDDGIPDIKYEFSCGKTPRDLKFIGDYLLVSCTDSNCVEVYQVTGEKAYKIDEAEVFQPITFAIDGERK